MSEEAKVTPGVFAIIQWSGEREQDEFTKRENWRGTTCVETY